jgi:predicted nucleotidyltransferase
MPTAPTSLTIKPLVDLIDALRSLLPALSAQYHIRSLALFGSYARQEQTAQSDLDVLVEFEEPPSLFEFIRLERQLSEELGVKVDLVMKTALKPAIGRRIMQEMVPV